MFPESFVFSIYITWYSFSVLPWWQVLTREVGAGATVSALLSGGMGGWRGRAQQIIALQDKVRWGKETGIRRQERKKRIIIGVGPNVGH